MLRRSGLIFLSGLVLPMGLKAVEPAPYLEPGALRLSHDLELENVLHSLQPGWTATENGRDKAFSQQGSEKRPWKSEWGERLLTDVAARPDDDIFGRVLLEAQGEYADRFWRPINIDQAEKSDGHPVFVREAEGSIDKENWYAHGFSGVGHNDWRGSGDFFTLYPEQYPDDDYLGSSGSFGVYPENWKQDFLLNMSKRHVPRGVEAGADVMSVQTAVAFGNEIAWGERNSVFGRATLPIWDSKFTFVGKYEDVPYLHAPYNFDNDGERRTAYALSWDRPSEDAHRIQAGVMYQPFRVGENYQVERTVSAGTGILGSSVGVAQKTTKTKDAFAERLRLERHQPIGSRVLIGVVDLTHAGLLAGNKNEAGLELGTDVTPEIHGMVKALYRKPLEGPMPLMYEGSPSNIGAIAVSPRGPESPFTVDWDNRELVSIVTTLAFDPTTGTNMFLYDPSNLALWNVNPKENAAFAVAVQHRMNNYKTATDRQWYFNEFGDVVWDPAAHTGAWASDGFLHDFRVLLLSRLGSWKGSLGLAGGQAPAISGLAYGTDGSQNKAITDYFSIEARVENKRMAFWGHYGSGVWGPERNIHPFFGFAFDRLYGVGTTYNFTASTSLDLSYIGARQYTGTFAAPDLGSYDEIRTVFSYRFGFLFQFQGAAKPGYKS